MSVDAWITLAVLAFVLAVLIREVVAPAAAVLSGVIVLLLTGVLEPSEAFSGFANPATITVAALFVVARAVRGTGGLQAALEQALGPDRSDRATLFRLVAPVTALSSVMNNTPIVATLAPMVRQWADRTGRPASRYLMPLSFAAILGGTITAIGTSTTLVVSGLLTQSDLAPFSLLEITVVGLPLAILGGLAMVVLGPRLLPDRQAPLAPARGDAGTDATIQRAYTVRLRVVGFGPIDGATVSEAGLRNLADVFLAELDRPGATIAPVSPDDTLHGGDVLTFVGQVSEVRDLLSRAGLEAADAEVVGDLTASRHQYAEVVIGASSPLAGRTLKEVGFRAHYDAAVIAIHRAGDRVEGKLGTARLQVGDVLLLLADPDFVSRWRDARDFLLVTALEHAPAVGEAAPTPVRGRQRSARTSDRLVLVILVGMLVAAATGVVPILQAALGAVLLLVGTGTLSVAKARDAVDIDVVLIVAGSLGLGAAVEVSGLAGLVADRAFDLASGVGAGRIGALALVVVATLILTELITNTAAAALLLPVALDVAARVDADPRGFAVAVAISASASFLTPVGYQTNTMVYGIGGYRYGDYWRLGAPLTLVVFVVVVGGVGLFWS